MTQLATARPLVIDASVAAKWLLRDEQHTKQADDLLHAWDEGSVLLLAPQQIEVEVGATLRKAVLNDRISETGARRSLDRWLDLLLPRFRLSPNELLLRPALRRSLELGITLFDALYVALAEEARVELLVADERLLRSAASPLRFLVPLESLDLSS